MSVKIVRETPSEGGWRMSQFEVFGQFEFEEEALTFLNSDAFKLVETQFDKFWQDNVKWAWDRYRIEGDDL